MTEASPRRGSIARTATCRHCGYDLVNRGKSPLWLHVGTLQTTCDPEASVTADLARDDFLRKAEECEHPRLYFCPVSDEQECPDCGGFDVCCSRPDMHREARQ